MRREFTGMMQVMLDPSLFRVGVGVKDLEARRVIEGCNIAFIASRVLRIMYMMLEMLLYIP